MEEFRRWFNLWQDQAIACEQQLDEKVPTTASVETERTQQDKCLIEAEMTQEDKYSEHMEVEQDANLLHNSSKLLGRYNRSRRNLTEV